MILKKQDLMEFDLGQVSFGLDHTTSPPKTLFSLSTGGGQCQLHNTCLSGDPTLDLESFQSKLVILRVAIFTLIVKFNLNEDSSGYKRLATSKEKSSASVMWSHCVDSKEIVFVMTDCKQVCRVVFRGINYTNGKATEFLRNLHNFTEEAIEDIRECLTKIQSDS